MPNSTPKPPSHWPIAWRESLRNLAREPRGWYVLAQASTRPGLTDAHRRASAFRASLGAFDGWDPEVEAFYRKLDICFRTRCVEGRWVLAMQAKPHTRTIEQILRESSQDTHSGD